MHRHSYLPAALLPLLALFAALPAAAQLEVEDVAFDPGAATWQDSLTAHLDVISTCFTGDEVDEEIAVGTSFEAGVGVVVTLTVPLDCRRDPALPLPYALSAALGHLTPGDYLLRVALDNGDVVHEEPFTVYRVGEILVDVPGAPVTDAAPFTLGISGLTGCGFGFLEASVQPDNVLEVLVNRNCPILPPGESFTREEIEVGPLAAGDWEVRVLDSSFGSPPPELVRHELTVYDDDLCVPSPTVLCLNGNRFRVDVAWHGFQGGSGDGQAVQLPERDDTGLFWFFDEDNVELTVKVLDGCGVNGHYWVFVSSGSTVGYQIAVTDTLAHEQSHYSKALGTTPELIPDAAAFATCP